MPNKKLTKAYWNSKLDIIESSVKGWNPQKMLPRHLQEAYPDLKAVSFGFFSADDLQERHSVGWELMSTDLFDVDEFNKSDIPARFGLVVKDGAIMWRDNYLMIMGKDYRKQLVKARHDHHEEQYSASIRNKKYTAPSDPRGKEMSQYAESKLDESVEVVKPTGDSVAPKRGPGRPPKQK